MVLVRPGAARLTSLTEGRPAPCRAYPGGSRDEEATVRLSTRNQLPATVESITLGEAMAVVKVTVDGGHRMTATITREAAEDLGLAEGTQVTVLVKSTEVMLGVE